MREDSCLKRCTHQLVRTEASAPGPRFIPRALPMAQDKVQALVTAIDQALRAQCLVR